MKVFETLSYRRYLQETFRPGRGRKKADAAAAMRCHATYFSAVLKGKSDLNLEQAERLARHLGFDAGEKRYFLLLVNMERAGTSELRKHFEAEVQQLRDELLSSEKEFPKNFHLDAEALVKYCQSWETGAVHLACALERLTTPAKIAAYLGLHLGDVRAALDFLAQHGLIQKDRAGHYRPSKKVVDLGANPGIASVLVRQWILRAYQTSAQLRKRSFYWAGALSLPQELAERFHLELKNQTQAKLAQLREDQLKDDELYGMCVAFYPMGADTGEES